MILLIQSSESQFSGNETPPPEVSVLLFKRGFVWCSDRRRQMHVFFLVPHPSVLWTRRWDWVVVTWWHHSGTGSPACKTSWSTSEGSDLSLLPARSTERRCGEDRAFQRPASQSYDVGWHHSRELGHLQWASRRHLSRCIYLAQWNGFLIWWSALSGLPFPLFWSICLIWSIQAGQLLPLRYIWQLFLDTVPSSESSLVFSVYHSQLCMRSG